MTCDESNERAGWPEIGTSGSMSGDGKRAIGKASSTTPILDSTLPDP